MNDKKIVSDEQIKNRRESVQITPNDAYSTGVAHGAVWCRDIYESHISSLTEKLNKAVEENDRLKTLIRNVIHFSRGFFLTSEYSSESAEKCYELFMRINSPHK